METIESRNLLVYFPRSGLVELASVMKRAGFNEEEILQVVDAVSEELTIVNEQVIYGKALEIAIKEAPSGFDTYFLALSTMTNSLLITDDKGMAHHAKNLGINVLFIRKTTIREIEEKLRCN